MQKILSKKEKAILSVTIGVLILSVGLNLMVIPLLNRNEVLNQEININKAKLNKYVSLLRQKESIQDKYKKIFNCFTGNPVEFNKADSVLSGLDNLAKNADIRIIDMRPQGIYKGRDLNRELAIDLKTEGEMENYLKFLYEFEYSLPFLKVKKFQLNAKPNTIFLEGIFTISQISSLE